MKLKSTPRIGVFTKQLDNWQSGSGHHLYEIMSHVLDLYDRHSSEESSIPKIDFTFIHYKKSNNPIYERVRELIIPRNPLYAAMIVRKEKFDLVHYTPLTIYAPIWGVPNKKIATIHGVEQLLLPQFFSPVEMFHERFLVPIFARHMDGIFTVSYTTKNYMVEHFHVPSEKITVAYNGIDPEYRPYSRSELQAAARYGLTAPYIYHVSNFSERKNPWVLLEAFAHFLTMNKNITNDSIAEYDNKSSRRPHYLVCAGNGWNNSDVQDRAKALHIEDRLITPGFISKSDSAELMAGADAFVFPSLAEGFGMPNVEAMASGCPVITTAAFAVPEIVGDAAIIVQDMKDSQALANAIALVVDNREFRENLIQKGLARVRSNLFSWDVAAKKLLDLYYRVLKDD